MKGDFTRGIRPDAKRGKSYRRVLLQQGRPILDSDVASLIDALDSSTRDTIRMTTCHHGSSDFGFLTTPGRLLAQFDDAFGNDFEATGGAEVLRDYGLKYLKRFPGLRIGGGAGSVTVSLDEPLLAPTSVRIWARADNGGATLSVNGVSTPIPVGPNFQPFDVTLSGADLVFAPDATARYWIGLVETVAPSSDSAVFHAAAGAYAINGLIARTPGGAWPALNDPAGADLDKRQRLRAGRLASRLS